MKTILLAAVVITLAFPRHAAAEAPSLESLGAVPTLEAPPAKETELRQESLSPEPMSLIARLAYVMDSGKNLSDEGHVLGILAGTHWSCGEPRRLYSFAPRDRGIRRHLIKGGLRKELQTFDWVAGSGYVGELYDAVGAVRESEIIRPARLNADDPWRLVSIRTRAGSPSTLEFCQAESEETLEPKYTIVPHGNGVRKNPKPTP